MSGVSRAFSTQGAVDVDAVAAALRPAFNVAAAAVQTVSHTWLETFDWRLHSAGISLRFARGGPLVMQLPDGARVQAPLAVLPLTRARCIPLNGTRSGVKLRPETPAAVAIADMLMGFTTAIEENVPGTVASIDIEFLHDLRVAVRRTRSILKLVGDVLPDGLAERFAPEFKWLGDLTTPVRDLDVYLLEFDSMAARLTSADPHDLDPFRAFLAKHRGTERRRLVRGLRSRRFQQLISDWRAALGQVATVADGGPTVATLARRRLTQAYRNAARRGRQIEETSPSDDVHALRKRCKELRYLLEVFRPVCDNTAHRA